MSDLAKSRPAASPSSDTVSVEDAGRFAALAIASAFVGFFLMSGMPQLTLDVFPRTLTIHIIYAVVAIVYVAYLATARRLPGGSPLDFAVAGVIAAWALATYTSVDWRMSLEPTLLLGAAIIVFYALQDLPFLDAQQLRRALLIAGGLMSAYAVWIVGNDYATYLQYVSDIEGLNSGNIFPPTVPRVHGVGDHPNVVAMLITLIMPFAAITAYRSASRWERLSGWVVLAFGALAIFLTLSRAGWIGVAGGVAFTLVGAMITSRAHAREEQGFAPSWENAIPRDISPTALATIGGALVLIVGGTLAFLSNSATRPGWLFRSSLSPREDAWRTGLDMFADNPWTGAGPNSFGLLYPSYGGKFLVHTQHAHNGFLQAATDAGIVGLLALAGIAIAIAYMLLRTWREGTLDQRLLAIGAGGALIGFSLHNQLDAGNIWKSPPIALALVGAIIVRNYRERPQREDASPRPQRGPRWHEQASLAARGVLLAMIVLPFVAWWRIDAAHYDYWRGLDDFNTTRSQGIARLQSAVNADSSVMVYQLQLGQAQATLFNNTGRRDRALLDAAIIHLEQAVKIDPRSDLGRANLAQAYALAGRTEDAAREAKIVRLAGHHVPPVLAAGEVYESIGMEDDAISTYGQVISMDSGLADSTFWDGTAFRKERYNDILNASSLAANPCTLGSYIVHAHRLNPTAPLDGIEDAEEGCKILVVQFPQDLVIRTALGRIHLAQQEYDDAFVHLGYAVDRQPDFGPARTEMGLWAAAQGDMEEAKHQWLIGGQLEQAESVVLLGETYPDGEVPQDLRDRLGVLLGETGSSVQNDTISVLYHRFRFGRMSPVYAMIPGQWQNAVPRVYARMLATLTNWNNAARSAGAR